MGTILEDSHSVLPRRLKPFVQLRWPMYGHLTSFWVFVCAKRILCHPLLGYRGSRAMAGYLNVVENTAHLYSYNGFHDIYETQ